MPALPFTTASRASQVLADELRPQEQVLRRIAGDGQLGEGDQVDAEGAGPLDAAQYLGDVALEIADGGVYLGQADAQNRHPQPLAPSLLGLSLPLRRRVKVRRSLAPRSSLPP